MATKKQIKVIHTLKNRLGWSDEEYRRFLSEQTNGFCVSSLEIGDELLDKIISKMRRLANQYYKYEDLDGREGMASPKQLRMIEAMWKDVSRAKSDDERLKALRAFLLNRFGVSDLRFLESWQVRKVIEALKNMRGR
jgi:phage gp16-like protein